MSQPTAIKYRAFLSYSHRDKAWGQWLHSALESYRIDKDLVGRETFAGPVPKTLRPIFRDREDFSAGHSLTEQTLAALEASQFLIVICSPAAAQSRYVNEEIRRFKAMGRDQRIIPVIVDGEPGDADRECFPEALRFKIRPDATLTDGREEPIAADARAQGDGKDIAKQKVVAGLLGLGLDEIVRRSERARKRRNRFWAALAGTFLLLAVGGTSSGVYAWQQLKTNEAFLDATLKRATDIVNTAVTQAEKYRVPRAATLELLSKAEGLFDDMARLGRPTPELMYRKAAMLMAFARSYGVLGNTDAVRERTKAALDLAQDLQARGHRNPDIQFALSDALLLLGWALEVQGELGEAMSNYEASLAIAQPFAAADPKDLNWQAVLSMSNERIGDVLKRQGRLAEAIKYYEADFDLAQRVMSVRLPAVLDKLGGTYLALGNRNGAFQAYQRMLVVSERLSAEISDPLWKGYLCSSHQNLGRLLMGQGRFDDALAHFSASLSIAEQIVSKDPSDATWQHTLGAAHGYIGSVHLTQGSVQKAVESNKKKLAILERLTASDPKNVFWQNDLATTHVSIGESYLVEGRIDDAHASFRAGHVILEGLAAIDPSDVKWRLNFLGSHLRLALFGDDQVRRFEFVVSTLRIIKEGNRLTLEEERWVPFAEEGLAAVAAGNLQWHWDLLQVFWRAAPITENPIRWRAALVARLRKLDDEGKLTIEQAQWLALAEEYVTKLRQPKQ